MRILLLTAVLAACAAAGGSLAQTPPPGQPPLKAPEPTFVTPQLRKLSPAPATPGPPAAAAKPRFSALPQAAPRTRGYVEPAGGGSLCRTACASDYYACLRREDMTHCGPLWAACQSVCPDTSSSP